MKIRIPQLPANRCQFTISISSLTTFSAFLPLSDGLNWSSLSVNFKPNVGQRSEKPFELTQADGDLLKKSLILQNQYEIICQCLIELIEIPFPHSKSIRPALVLNIIKRVFDTSLSDYSKSEGNEAKILFFVMPKIYCASMNLGKILMV